MCICALFLWIQQIGYLSCGLIFKSFCLNSVRIWGLLHIQYHEKNKCPLQHKNHLTSEIYRHPLIIWILKWLPYHAIGWGAVCVRQNFSQWPISRFHRPVTLHKNSAKLPPDSSEMRMSPYENRLHWTIYFSVSWSFQILCTIKLWIIALWNCQGSQRKSNMGKEPIHA